MSHLRKEFEGDLSKIKKGIITDKDRVKQVDASSGWESWEWNPYLFKPFDPHQEPVQTPVASEKKGE
jgi:hypothetical protein